MFEIGSSLRDARVRQGLDLPEVEADTKIRAKYLRALEDERFDLLPGDAYAKGFLRTYADRLGLDGQLYVDEYNSRFSDGEEPLFSSTPRQQARRRLESHAVLVALAGIVAVTVLVIAAWQLGGSADRGDGEGGIVPDSVSSLESTGSAPEETPAATTPAVATSVALIVTAERGPSRVEVRQGSARGELLYEDTLAEGKSETFAAKKLWLRVGDPKNVSVTVNGLAQDLGTKGPATAVVTETGIRLDSPS